MKNIKHVNPDALMKSSAFSQAVVVQGNGRHVYIGGQNSVDVNGEIVGKDDIRVQTNQIMKNMDIALHACGASFKNLLKFSIFIVQGQDASIAFDESQKFLKKISAPPVVTVLYVAGLGRADFLLEVDAVAFVPD
ncbi:MAG: RidA family protein [Gammaproteobacteria bacterium]|nr:MAG: RidA family protein [Gammaproteobacteria bacterium]